MVPVLLDHPAREQRMLPDGARKQLARLGLLIASVTVTLALCEAFVRIAHIGPEVSLMPSRIFRLSGNPLLRYEHIPNMTYQQYVINEHGLRGKAFARTKDRDVFRIAVVGDSVSFGWDVGEGQPWPDVLQRLLGEHHLSNRRTFQVVNFSVPGYNAIQIAETVRQKVRPWAPDLVMYAYCVNDPQQYSIAFEELLDQLSQSNRKWMRQSHRHVLGRSRLLQFLLLRLRADAATLGQERETTWRDDPQFKALEAGRGARYFVRLHRNPETFKNVERALARMSRGNDVIVCFFPLFSELENKAMNAISGAVGAAAEKQELAFEDLTADFIEARSQGVLLSHAHDPLHLTAEGHGVAAHAVLRVVLTHLHNQAASDDQVDRQAVRR